MNLEHRMISSRKEATELIIKEKRNDAGAGNNCS